MSLVSIANLCSHLQNASRARLSQTSFPMTKMHLTLFLAMQKQGLVSTVQVAGSNPPIPDSELDLGPRSIEAFEDMEHQMEEEKAPWLALAFDARKFDVQEYKKPKRINEQKETDILPERAEAKRVSKLVNTIGLSGVPKNPANRRIWLGLKYWNDEPVIKNMSMVSKPRKRITATITDLNKLARGRRAGEVQGLVSPGECMFVSTDIGILEIREAITRHRGGLLMVRTD